MARRRVCLCALLALAQARIGANVGVATPLGRGRGERNDEEPDTDWRRREPSSKELVPARASNAERIRRQLNDMLPHVQVRVAPRVSSAYFFFVPSLGRDRARARVFRRTRASF